MQGERKLIRSDTMVPFDSASSRGAKRRLFTRVLFVAAVATTLVTALVACGSDDEAQNGSGQSAYAPDYEPVEAAAQNPLPPGVTPRDGAPTPMPTTTVDASKPDTATTPDTSTTDSATSSDGGAG